MKTNYYKRIITVVLCVSLIFVVGWKSQSAWDTAKRLLSRNNTWTGINSFTNSSTTYGSDGSITDAELLYINTLSSNAQTQLNSMLENVVEDTTPQLGGDLEYNESHQVFDTTLTSDDTASGDIITVTFGETVVFGEVCYPNATENEWMKALGTNAAVKHPGMGIALESKANGASGKLLLRGTIRDDSAFAGAMGDVVFLSDGTAGDMLYTAPADSGDIVQILGFVIAENYIYFNPDYTYVEID